MQLEMAGVLVDIETELEPQEQKVSGDAVAAQSEEVSFQNVKQPRSSLRCYNGHGMGLNS